MVHTHKKQKAIALRIAGKSYGEIVKILALPSKGTLSYWFKNLKLPAEAKERLSEKMRRAHEKGILNFNRERTRRILLENSMHFEAAIKSIKNITRGGLILIGAALYWGEGSLRNLSYGYPRISFTNSDANMVKVFIRFLKEALFVDDDKIRFSIQIHPNIKASVARGYWSKITGFHHHNFPVFDQISKAGRNKRPKNFLPYGTLHVKVSDRRFFYKIKGHIQGIVNQLT